MLRFRQALWSGLLLGLVFLAGGCQAAAPSSATSTPAVEASSIPTHTATVTPGPTATPQPTATPSPAVAPSRALISQVRLTLDDLPEGYFDQTETFQGKVDELWRVQADIAAEYAYIHGGVLTTIYGKSYWLTDPEEIAAVQRRLDHPSTVLNIVGPKLVGNLTVRSSKAQPSPIGDQGVYIAIQVMRRDLPMTFEIYAFRRGAIFIVLQRLKIDEEALETKLDLEVLEDLARLLDRRAQEVQGLSP